MRDNQKLLKGLKKWNLTINETQQQQFEDYFDLLVEWNSFMNLTGITDYEEVLVKHFLDSAALFQSVPYKENATLLDMGTGAGFPGLPLKILYPDLRVTLVDSLNKRIKFLQAVIEKLALEDIAAIHGRAEELARKEEYRENFDFVVSRAVAKISSLSEFCIPYVKVNGFFVPYKSGQIKEEMQEGERAIKLLGGKLVSTYSFTVPESDLERSLPVIKKINHTPKAYPRAGGKPLKAPL